MQRDHGTVMHNVKVMNGMLDVYPEVQEEWRDYKKDVSDKISDPQRS
jgi:chromosomal replication initiation ATPase DnaA